MAAELLHAVGARVRTLREGRGFSRRALAERSGLSERFLAQLERGEGNISLRRFADLASALETTPAAILSASEKAPSALSIALLGVRGAGKSTVGRRLAETLGWPFVEIDQRIEAAAGLSLGEIFELHGEAYYRQTERSELLRLLAGEACVVAVGGGIVTDARSFAVLRERTRTVWLRADPEHHWQRVLAQGDTRPMADNEQAFVDLRRILAEREPLYRQADVTVDTSAHSVAEAIDAIERELSAMPA
jgi:XRE family aerobic/anaerobic benzoate catabolism transcriptional regulator